MRILLVLLWCLLLGAGGWYWYNETRRHEELEMLGQGPGAVAGCPGQMDELAVTSVRVYFDLREAMKHGSLDRARENAKALSQYYSTLNPILSSSAAKLAVASDLDSARREFNEMEAMIADPSKFKRTAGPNVRVP